MTVKTDFENVDVSPQPRPEEKLVDLDIEVKERPTGFFSIGGGYSSVEQFIAMVELTQGNLFGRGQFAKIRAELGGRTKEANSGTTLKTKAVRMRILAFLEINSGAK